MTNEPNDANSDVTPELVQKLQDVKDRCAPPHRMHFKTCYIFLFVASMIVYFSHLLVSDAIDWDSLRYSHGLLPLDVLMLRNPIVPTMLPALVVLFAVLSAKFKSLRSANFLVWFTLFLFGLSALHTWVLGMFIFFMMGRVGP
ncbi:MAG: hypothetical protein CVV41_09730 [Candidatus Riflebacteria bacterium HGW-Riflebacteria-1]|jgi:hypothetical protein|nr:MAG: hypothetical protein CVV41_09730 [Candidatus Riflebacteria bacterium HGW-Riflebacteria-1]